MHIFKYLVGCVPGKYTIAMPRGSRVISVGLQGNFIALWAKAPATTDRELITAHVIYTGCSVPPGDFIGTVIDDSSLVHHVFVEHSRSN